jgi:hypothetical protein
LSNQLQINKNNEYKKIIVVGDDFGFSRGVNQGHVEAQLNGIPAEHSFILII